MGLGEDILSRSLIVLRFWMGGLMLLANWGVYVIKNYYFKFCLLVVLLIFVLILAFSV